MADSQARIFISYRREDSAGHVLALLPELRRHFGDRVFKDTDSIPPGEDFVRFIRSELESCSVLLAVIGRDWLNVQDPRLKTRRLDNPDDFLRIELSTALKSEHIRVIPVLVERSTMPSAADLPADLAELAHRNALELSDARWESDVRLLIQAIQRAFAPAVEHTEAPPRQELQDFQKRRAREIVAHLAAGQEAFDARDYDGTLLSCEKVLLLDPKRIEALELLDRARKAIDNQKIETSLKQARQSLCHGDIAGASDFIDQALSIDSDSETALALRKEMLAVRRERERDRERRRAVVGAVQRARTSLDEGDLDAAVRHADDALALEPQSADAQDVRSRAVAAVDERRRQREAGRRAQQAATAEARGRTEAARDTETQRRTEARPREHADAEREREPASEARELPAAPEFWSIRRYGTLAAAAAVILGSAIGLWQYQRLSDLPSTPDINQSSNASDRATTDPSAAVGASDRETASVTVPASTPQPNDKGTVGGNSAAPGSTEPAATRPSRRSSVPVRTLATEPTKEEKEAGSSVSPIPKEPPDAGPSRRSIAVSEMIMNPLLGERVLVAQVMKQYVTAYNGRNAAAVKEVYPSFDGDVREFVDTYQLENVTVYVSADGASATVSAKERTYYNYEGKKTPTSADCTFTLKKQGDSWIILSIERRNIRV